MQSPQSATPTAPTSSPAPQPERQVSKVIHVRAGPDISPQDIIGFLNQFGQVEYIVPLPKINQALVEMNSVDAAVAAIQWVEENSPVQMKDKEVRFQFSKSQEIEKKIGLADGPSRPDVQNQGEHVLLITIHNPLYPITMDVLAHILQPHGVQRIVLFQKNGVQALAEFPDSDAAEAARKTLDGKQIYQGCCTLRIVYSRNQRLNVKYNNEKTMDFTQQLPSGPSPAARPAVPAQVPLVPYVQAPYGQQFQPAMYQPQMNAPGPVAGPAAPAMPAGGPFPQGAEMGMMGVPGMQAGNLPGRTVLICYNLEEHLTCDSIFNLFCLYGNVQKIKRLPLKPGCALIQMGDARQAEAARNYLNGSKLFRQRLEIQFSKHPHIKDPREPPSNEDPGNPFTKDFSSSTLNRFRRPMSSSFRHRYKPTPVLHFSHAPLGTTEQQITELLAQAGAPAPVGLKFFETLAPANATASGANPGQTERRERAWRNGLMQFENATAAAEACCLCNHTRMESQTLRLAFSVNTVF